MIRISILGIALALSLGSPALAEESKPSQMQSRAAQSKDACRAECEAEYNQDKACEGGVAPMHSPCEIFDQCLNDCK
jgi:hypothetical protein